MSRTYGARPHDCGYPALTRWANSAAPTALIQRLSGSVVRVVGFDGTRRCCLRPWKANLQSRSAPVFFPLWPIWARWL